MSQISVYSLLAHYGDDLAPGAAGWNSWRVLATDRNVVCPEWEISQISIKQEVNEGGALSFCIPLCPSSTGSNLGTYIINEHTSQPDR